MNFRPLSRCDRLVVHQYDPQHPSQGGIDTCISDLVKYAPADFRFGIVGVTTERQRLGRWSTVEIFGREVDYLPVARLSAGDQARKLPHSLRVAAGFLAYVRETPKGLPVQVHRLDTGAVVAVRFPNVRRIQFIHNPTSGTGGHGSDSFWRHAPQIQHLIERRALRGAPAFVFSKGDAARLAKEGFDATRCTTWFDPDLHFPQPADRTRGRRVLWVGRMENQKDPELAVRAFAAAARAGIAEDLEMVGDGTLRPLVEAAVAAEQIGDRVKLRGAVSRGAVADAMRAADVMLMTSHYEGSPRALIEALACGAAIAATEGSDPDGLIVGGVNGAVARTRSADALAEALAAALKVDRRRCTETVASLAAPVAVRRLLEMSS
jgi:glycosyltransferase involved in cell wall biosynthesis